MVDSALTLGAAHLFVDGYDFDRVVFRSEFERNLSHGSTGVCDKLDPIFLVPEYSAPCSGDERESHSYTFGETTAEFGSRRGTHGLAQLGEIVANPLEELALFFGKEYLGHSRSGAIDMSMTLGNIMSTKRVVLQSEGVPIEPEGVGTCGGLRSSVPAFVAELARVKPLSLCCALVKRSSMSNPVKSPLAFRLLGDQFHKELLKNIVNSIQAGLGVQRFAEPEPRRCRQAIPGCWALG